MRKFQRGFTLVEMLVVASIIAIVAITTFSTVRHSAAEARDAKRYKDLDNIEAALYAFYADNGHFPDTNNVWWDVCTTDTTDTSDHIADGGWIPGLAPDFISSLPTDPRGCRASPGTFNGYIYRSTAGGTDFKVAADWTAEVGELCDDPGDKYWDPRGAATIPAGAVAFCSVSSPGGINL